MMLNGPDLMNLEVSLRSLQQAHEADFHLMASAMIVLLIFFPCQCSFVRGITLTGGK